jgi:hypothetical protein
MDTSMAVAWRGAKVGDWVTLSDTRTLEQRMAEGRGPTAASYEIRSILKIGAPLFEWRLCAVDDRGTWVVAKIADDVVSLYAYREGDWRPATRSELIAEGALFLFQEPPDPERFNPEDLKYTLDIARERDGKKVLYAMKPQGEITGEAEWIPPKSGLSDLLGTVAEYQADEEVDDAELMVVEVGPKEGGVIKLMVGRLLQPNEIVLLPH